MMKTKLGLLAEHDANAVVASRVTAAIVIDTMAATGLWWCTGIPVYECK